MKEETINISGRFAYMVLLDDEGKEYFPSSISVEEWDDDIRDWKRIFWRFYFSRLKSRSV